MPFKCSVKGCRSNYDSTNEKVSVFQFPTEAKARLEWTKNIELNSKLTNSSRICIKHFRLDDIEVTNKRSLLKFQAIPRSSFELGIATESLEYLEESAETQEIDEKDRINGFAQFCLGLEEIQVTYIDNWNIYNQHEGVCFYRLSNRDDDFNDVKFSFKVLINKHMRVKLFSNEDEASGEELKWILKDCQLQSWSQLDRILVNYQTEPEVVMTIKPMKYLMKAIDALDRVRRIELQSKIDSVKAQLLAIHRMAELLPKIEEEDFYMKPPVEEFAVQSIQEDASARDSYEEEFLENESSQEDENSPLDSESVEHIIMSPSDPLELYPPEERAEHRDTAMGTDEDDHLIHYENPLKCDNCFITLQSEVGFRAHQKTCNTPITNVNINTMKIKLSRTLPAPKNEMNVCDICGKSFKTMKGLKEHMKLHNKAYRQKCPLCNVVVFAGVMKRHIRAVHNKLKPHAW